jgi:hypothetical protein
MGEFVEATNDDTVSIVLVPVTRGTTISEADIPEVVITVVCEGIG